MQLVSGNRTLAKQKLEGHPAIKPLPPQCSSKQWEDHINRQEGGTHVHYCTSGNGLY